MTIILFRVNFMDSFSYISMLSSVSSEHKPYEILLFLGLILLLSKGISLGLGKLKMPRVIGFLISGLIVGLISLIPSSWLQESYSYSKTGLDFFAKVGVILIMFSAGLETDLNKVKSLGVKSVVITSLGVIFPLIFGYLAAFSVNRCTNGALNIAGVNPTFTELYYGVILSATSVSITVATLKEIHKLDTPVGTALISAAILDDIIGIVLLSLVISLANTGSGAVDKGTFAGMILNATGLANNTAISIIFIILFMALFFVLTFFLGKFVKRFFDYLNKKHPHHIRITIFALGIAFLWSYLAEYFSIADITGAFMVGLTLSKSGPESYIDHRSETISDNVFAPVFFACIAMNMFGSVSSFSSTFLLFGIIWVIVGLLGKVLGAGIGGLVTKFSFADSLCIGVGMMARAEVLIVCAQKGIDAGLIDSQIMVYTLALILISSFATPLILKFIYREEAKLGIDGSEKGRESLNSENK